MNTSLPKQTHYNTSATSKYQKQNNNLHLQQYLHRNHLAENMSTERQRHQRYYPYNKISSLRLQFLHIGQHSHSSSKISLTGQISSSGFPRYLLQNLLFHFGLATKYYKLIMHKAPIEKWWLWGSCSSNLAFTLFCMNLAIHSFQILAYIYIYGKC